MKKIVTLGLAVLLLAGLTLIPATAATTASSPFDFLTLPASAWGTNHPDQMVGADNATVSAAGGAGSALVLTRTNYGWPSAVLTFDGPMTMRAGDKLFFTLDNELTQENPANDAYIQIFLATVPNLNGIAGDPGGSLVQLNSEKLGTGRQTGELELPPAAVHPQYYGIWIQLVGTGTATVYGLNIGDTAIVVADIPAPPTAQPSPSPSPSPTATAPAGATGSPPSTSNNPKTSDPGIAMIVMTGLAGLAGLAGAGILVGKKRK